MAFTSIFTRTPDGKQRRLDLDWTEIGDRPAIRLNVVRTTGQEKATEQLNLSLAEARQVRDALATMAFEKGDQA